MVRNFQFVFILNSFRLVSNFELDINEIAMFSACLASTDIIISLSVTPYKSFPTIFTIILGAGLYNDTVVVVLTQAFSE